MNESLIVAEFIFQIREYFITYYSPALWECWYAPIKALNLQQHSSENSERPQKNGYKHKARPRANFNTTEQNRQTNIPSAMSTLRTAKPRRFLPPRGTKRRTNVEKVSSFRGRVTWTAGAKITPLEPPAKRRAFFRHRVRRYRPPATFSHPVSSSPLLPS